MLVFGSFLEENIFEKYYDFLILKEYSYGFY